MSRLQFEQESNEATPIQSGSGCWAAYYVVGAPSVRRQCTVSTGSVIDFSTVRDAPPSTSSRARWWP